MNEVTLFVQTVKNRHDDACDSLAMLVEFLDTKGCGDSGKEAIFRTRGWSVPECTLYCSVGECIIGMP